MADTSYITSGNNADLVKLVKDYALYLFPLDTGEFEPPTNEEWQPPQGARPVGYNSEDGAVLHPEPGDDTEIKAHNGDIVVSEQDPGYWTLQIPGIECRRSIAEAYFGVTADESGAFHVRDATTNRQYGLVLACLDQYGNPIVLCAGKAQVSDRDDMTMVSTEVLTFNATFKFFKAADGYQFHVYGLLAAEMAGLATAVTGLTATPETLSVEAGESGTFNVTVKPDNATGWKLAVSSGDETKATASVEGATVTVTGKAATETGKPVTVTVTAGDKSVAVPVTVTAAAGA
ncbi:Ig domain-containing protein [Bifidobacterium catulorum]|uniref:Ig domain-containing protein n=1 Tax=Bifidobacterium catulorum TaxID=1630173 RepID=UPI0018802193|nr:Ig domain-containing protein [Bifidobacterium catulorum]